jgi:DNA polymerase III subunit alpha
MARNKWAKTLLLKLNDAQDIFRKIDELIKIITPNLEGKTPVHIAYSNAKAKALLPLGTDWQVNLTDDLIQHLKDEFGELAVTIVY